MAVKKKISVVERAMREGAAIAVVLATDAGGP